MSNTITNESLKEYYVKLQGMYEKCADMLLAIHQSMSTNAAEVTVDLVSSNGDETTLRIPSYLWLESRLEQIESTLHALSDMPASGEAWFTSSTDMWKLKMVRTATAPLAPVIDDSQLYAGAETSVLLKDLVSPHTFLRADISNLPENIERLMMHKITISSQVLFNAIRDLGVTAYDDIRAALFHYVKGVDYDEYETPVVLPVKKDTYRSAFRIVSIPAFESGSNPWSTDAGLCYQLELDTLEYVDAENTSIRMTLKAGDYICLGNEVTTYLVKSVDESTNTVVIQEKVGHSDLQPTSVNSAIVFQIYNESYNGAKYANIPLEEDRYVIIFLSCIYNNTRSHWSDAMILDLGSINMKDEDGRYIRDDNGNILSYYDFYNKYCNNIGDLILGITEASFPQLSNYTGQQLYDLTNSVEIKNAVSSSIDNDILRVVPINKHLSNDVSTEEIISLHAQKNDIQASLSTVQDNISQVYNTLTSTDFSQETSNTMASLQSKLSSYYTERTSLQKQLNSIIDNINAKSLDVTVTASKVKYRIRGIADTLPVETVVHGLTDNKADIIGMEVQYKYKSTTKDTNTVTIINSSTFTDWNKQDSIERDRELVLDDNLSAWRLKFIDYTTTDNIIKWNQIDIPIRNGEDVVVRVRYKYSTGYPFVSLYTPWSDELTVVFPPEFRDDVTLETILDTNSKDTVVAGYRNILINEGYEEHVNNKLVSSDQVFFHQPDNIFSGFLTPENNLISLKDKLLQMSQDLEQYKSWVEGETNAKYEVYLQYDEQLVPLTPNSINHINIYNTDHITGSFIRKDINIVIKNTGETRVNFYSIFPGNVDISLLKSDIDAFKNNIIDYERVPLFIDNKLSLQNLGQWVYFRQTNPYTSEDIYYNTTEQREADVDVALAGEPYDMTWKVSAPKEYLMQNNAQVMLAFRDRLGIQSKESIVLNKYASALQQMLDYIDIVKDQGNMLLDGESYEDKSAIIEQQKQEILNNVTEIQSYDTAIHKAYNSWSDEDFKYINSCLSSKESSDAGVNNVYLMRYEDIQGKNQSTQATVFLDADTSFTTFLNYYRPKGFASESDFCGAFFYVSIPSRQILMTEGQSNDKIFIDKGEQITIPVVFEYFLDGQKTESETSSVDNTKVTKSLFFDLKSSLVKNPVHYMIEMTGNYDMTSTGDVYSNFATIELEDNVTSHD